MGGSAHEDAGEGESDDAGGIRDDPHEDVVDYPPDPPLVETLKGVVRTVQLAAFLALVLAPLLGGFLVPLGQPAYDVEIAAVNPSGSVTAGDVRPYGALDDRSRAAFDRLLEDPDNAVRVRADADDPPWLLAGETRTVVRDGLAFRVAVESRGPPLRFPAIVAGIALSALAAIAGYHFTEWDPV